MGFGITGLQRTSRGSSSAQRPCIPFQGRDALMTLAFLTNLMRTRRILVDTVGSESSLCISPTHSLASWASQYLARDIHLRGSRTESIRHSSESQYLARIVECQWELKLESSLEAPTVPGPLEVTGKPPQQALAAQSDRSSNRIP